MTFLHAAAAFLIAVSPAMLAAGAQPPNTTKQPVTDTYHGVQVVDDYRWLEDWSAARVKSWSEGQNAYGRSILDTLPSVPEIRARFTQLEGGGAVEHTDLSWTGGRLFAIKHQPPKQQPFLVTLTSANDLASERVLVDPNAIDPEGLTTIDWYVPSPDGKLVAVSMSEGGSESGTVHVFDVATGKETGDVIPRAQGGTAGGSLAWAGDGFYYTRYPRETDTPKRAADDMDFYVQVYFHRLGTKTDADTYELGKDFPKIAEIVLDRSDDGTTILASVQNGDGGEFMHWVKRDGNWTRLTVWDDKVVCAALGQRKSLYFVSRKGSPRGRVLKLALGEPLDKATLVVPEAADGAAIATDFFDRQGLLATASTLYVWYQTGGPCEVRAFPLGAAGESKGTRLDSPQVSTIGQMIDLENGKVLYSCESFVTPAAWYEAAPGAASHRTSLFQTSPADYSDCEVVREFATSKDGTKVPVNIIRQKGVHLPAPAIIWGYGGYGISESPSFSPRRRVFIEQGGVLVVANIRGGGEFGEDWHRQGNLTNKQNVFDDFYAAAMHMIDRGYTTKDKLAIMGGSNGGLLMGATFTQHPDLCKAVVSSVGIYDMLRVELSSNGAFNITEFGTVEDPAHFKALYAYSPYHHVKDGTGYPAILMLTGANDPRVDPMQSRKMIARLQAADTGGTFILRTSANAGHGIGSSLSERIEQSVDTYAFLFNELGVKYAPVK